MIIVRVELWSARDGSVTELARMRIANVGGDMVHRDYEGVSFKGRSAEQLDKQTTSHIGKLRGWPSERLHIWNLVRAMLQNMGYHAVK